MTAQPITTPRGPEPAHGPLACYRCGGWPCDCRDGQTLILGDAREVIPSLEIAIDTVLTDPVWPNNSVAEFREIDPTKLLAETLDLVNARRLILQFGCDSDPRILRSVPDRFPFLRVCWLRFARPSYKGRLLNGSEIAYLFGEPVPAAAFPGRRHLMPGESPTPMEVTANKNDRRLAAHPCPRRLEHVSWLAANFAQSTILDPFIGSGTTALACKKHGLLSIGIEKEPRFLDLACTRLANEPAALFPDA